MDAQEQVKKSGLVKALGILFILIGAILGAGGLWLMKLGGTDYYAFTGIVLIISGVQLLRHKFAGVYIYGVVLLVTVIWTAIESGSDYWRWVPRLGLFIVLAFLLALVLPHINTTITKSTSHRIAGIFVGIFVIAFGLAFVPYGVTKGKSIPDEGSVSVTAATAGATFQPASTPAEGDWAAYGQSEAATRYVSSKEITPDNIKKLKRVWTFRTGEIPSHGYGAETTPLKIGDTMYLCSGLNKLFALNAKDGTQIWAYDPQVSEDSIAYTAACRGVAYYEVKDAPDNMCKQRIIEATVDARLIVVDAKTGKPCNDFGAKGEVDLMTGLGDIVKGYVSPTSAPVVVQNVIVVNHQVIDGQRRDAPSGVIRGYDVASGKLLWAWDLKRPDITTLPPAGETYSKGTPNSWAPFTGDEKLGLVYLPMGNSAADYISSSRSAEENMYSTSLVALNVKTGKPAWHFQTVHKDVWDYDLGSQVSLIDFPTSTGKVPALILPSKQGDIYILNRETGAPITGVEERKVPQGGLEEGLRTETQPFSLYANLRKPDLTEEDMWGISPFDQLYCRIRFKQAAYDGFYTPPTTDKHWIQYPSYNGGSDWGSVSVDTSRGIIVANYNDMPNYNRLIPRSEADAMGLLPLGDPNRKQGGAEGAGPQMGTDYAIDVNAGWTVPFTGILCKQPPYGSIRAIDLLTGETLWDRPFGTARKNGPFGISSMLPINIGTPNNGGSVITGSGLVFIAAATDNLFRAIDIKTGETIWQDVLPAGGQATPISYEVDGKQYVTIVATGHHFMKTPPGDYVITYALGD